ncbi:MAG: metal ABC transporter substrate-binding protein [Thiohalorhabdus sp.]|uniref:metal ABC transporter substrate-binding protein n=1 Tax=Thiohalorhabdus sp. TaxID=3094134 RepID=UPI00397EF5AE
MPPPPRLLARVLACLALVPALAAAAPLEIVTSIPPYAMVARAVAGQEGEVQALVGRGKDPHHFEPSIDDIAHVREADLVISNGLGLRQVEDHLGRTARSEQLLTVAETVPFEPVRDQRGAVNGHIWLDPEVMVRVAQALAERMGELRPERADTFAANAEELVADIRDADAKAGELLGDLRNRGVVTYHPAFEYFFRHYDMEVVGTYLDLAGNEPSPQGVQKLLDTIREGGIPAIFREPQLPKDPVQALADEAGITVGVLDPLGFEADIQGYPDLLRYNARQVRDAYDG